MAAQVIDMTNNSIGFVMLWSCSDRKRGNEPKATPVTAPGIKPAS
jgi:hypothetical protein